MFSRDDPAAGSPEIASLEDVPAGTMLYIDADRFLGAGERFPGGPFELTATITPIVGLGDPCDASTLCVSGAFCGPSGTCEPSVCGDSQVTSGEDCDDPSDATCDSNCRKIGWSCASPVDINSKATSPTQWTWSGTTVGAPKNYNNICSPGGSGAKGPDVTGVFVPPFTGKYSFNMTSANDNFLQVYEGPCQAAPRFGMLCADSGTGTLLLEAGKSYVVVADDYSASNQGTFTITISAGERCGDGVVQPSERCDGTPGCSADCRMIGTCGDGIADPGEECDDGRPGGDRGCTRTCTLKPGWTCGAGGCDSICGDGVVVAGEDCENPSDPSCVNCGILGKSCRRPYDLNSLEESPGYWVWAGNTTGKPNTYGSCGSSSPTSPDMTGAFVAPVTGVYTIDMITSSGYDDYFQVRSGPCGGLQTELACMDTGAISLELIEGETYFVTADGYSSSNSGPFTVTIKLMSICGDGYVSEGERCDGEAGCSLGCTRLGTCGDGTIDAGEECDDRNPLPGDGCSLDCTIEAGWDCSTSPCTPICGDGIRVGPEECDDPANPSCVGCRLLGQSCDNPFDLATFEKSPGFWEWKGSTASKSNSFGSCGTNSPTSPDQVAMFVPPFTTSYVVDMDSSHDDFFHVLEGTCGGVLQQLVCRDTGSETVNLIQGETYFIVADGYGASNSGPFTVTVKAQTVCGDGFHGPGERCDGEPGCNSTCSMLGTCGDGVTDPGEECDDANLLHGDGCRMDCTIEPGWDCSTIPCVPICGDGVRTGNEACDDPSDPACVNCGYFAEGCRAPMDLNARLVAPGAWTWTGTTAGHPSTYGNKCGGTSGAAGADLTAAFVAPATGSYVVDMDSSHDDYFQVLSGTCGGPLTGMACVDSGAATVPMTQGRTYWVVADGYGSASSGTFTLTVKLTPSCGDGYRSANERCDGEPGCSANCQVIDSCGDGIIDPGEDCDDRNLVVGDGCDLGCVIEPGWTCTNAGCVPTCGDGVITGNEQCDDPGDPTCVNCGFLGGNCRNPLDLNGMQSAPGIWTWSGTTAGARNAYGACMTSTPTSPDKTAAFVAPVSGSYVVDMDSTHDDYFHVLEGLCGSTAQHPIACQDTGAATVTLTQGETYYVVADGFSSGNFGTFTITVKLNSSCGDGYVSQGERCDGQPGCSADCIAFEGCGDGILDAGEECDDGNARAGDGCSLDCTVEAGWDCSSGTCTGICGDGMVRGLEECDDASPSCVNCALLGRSCRYPEDMNAKELKPGYWGWAGNTSDGPNTYGNLCGGTSGAGPDRTAAFVPPVTGSYVVDMDSPHDDYFQVFTGTCGTGTGLACTDTGASTLTLNAGQTYWVVADGYGSASSGPFILSVVLNSVCRDGYVSAGERCDGAPGCDATCKFLGSCGDGVLDPGEDCDDGNLDVFDGCALDCTPTPGWSCAGGTCAPTCGDGIVTGPEQCDGSAPAGMTCDASCRLLPIAVPTNGSSVSVEGVLQPTSLTWNRPDELCAGSTSMKYSAYTFTNVGTADAWLEVIADWPVMNGWIHAYATPFNPAVPLTNCLAGNDDFRSAVDSKLLVKVAAGDSIVVVASAGASIYRAPFRLHVTSLTFTTGSEVEPNDTIGTATPITPFSFTKAASSPAGNSDFYAFTTQGSATYVIETYAGKIGMCKTGSAVGAGTATSSDTKIWLYDVNGVDVAADDDGGISNCSRLVWTAPAAGGTFYFDVRHYSTSPSVIDPYWVDLREYPAVP